LKKLENNVARNKIKHTSLRANEMSVAIQKIFSS